MEWERVPEREWEWEWDGSGSRLFQSWRRLKSRAEEPVERLLMEISCLQRG